MNLAPVHHFETADAMEYGVPKAIILYNLRSWLSLCSKDTHCRRQHTDGKTHVWICCSGPELQKSVPYIKLRTLWKYLTELTDAAIIIRTQEFNTAKPDTTYWYTMPECEVVR